MREDKQWLSPWGRKAMTLGEMQKCLSEIEEAVKNGALAYCDEELIRKYMTRVIVIASRILDAVAPDTSARPEVVHLEPNEMVTV